MNKAIIFDMDGVIIDSETVYAKIEWDIYEEYQVPITKENAIESMGRGLLNWWEEIKDRYGLPISAEEAANEVARRYMAYLNDTKIKKEPIAGIRHLMKKIKEKKWKMAIASSSDPDAIQTVIEIFKLQPFIDYTISGSDIIESKPHPEIFLKVAEHYQLEPEQCLVIEDSYHGIVAAKAAGMACAAYRSAPAGLIDYSSADFVYDDHHDVFPMIEKLLNN